MFFDYINFLLQQHDDRIEKQGRIDLIDYHYRVDNIYDDVILVDLDVDDCDLEFGSQIILLNKTYTLRNVEFLPHKNDFKYRLTLINNLEN